MEEPGDHDRQILLPDEDDDIELTISSLGNSNGISHTDDLDLDNLSSDLPPGSGNPANIVYISAAVAAIGGLLFGYDMGIISGAKSQMQTELGLSCAQVGSIVAFLPVGGFFASLIGGYAVDKHGRRMTIMVNAFLFTVGAIVMTFSSSIFFLLFGRFILGFAVSLSAIAECIYISEIASPDKRGMLVSLNELGITIGILVSFLVNYIFAETASGWRIMFGMSSVVAIGQGVAMIFLPQTPQFLMISKKEEKAEETIRKLQLSSNVRQTMTNIRLSLAEESSTSFVGMICQNADNIGSRLFIGIGLVFFQQFTGQPNMIYFAADIFRQVGFCSQWSSTLATVGLGLMKVLATVISLNLIDRIGRRKALMSGISGMLVSVFILCIYAFYAEELGGETIGETCTEVQDSNFIKSNATLNSTMDLLEEEKGGCMNPKVPPGLRYTAFVALVGFVCSFSFSFGPISWIVLSEIFPTTTKGRAMALATAINWMGNVIVSATFIGATAAFTLGGVFLFYTLMCVFAIIFVALLVPETKNKTLEQISKELRSKNARTIIRDNLRCRRKQRNLTRYDEYSQLPFSI